MYVIYPVRLRKRCLFVLSGSEPILKCHFLNDHSPLARRSDDRHLNVVGGELGHLVEDLAGPMQGKRQAGNTFMVQLTRRELKGAIRELGREKKI